MNKPTILVILSTVLSLSTAMVSNANTITETKAIENTSQVISINPTCESYVTGIPIIDDSKILIENKYYTCLDIVNPEETTWQDLVRFDKLTDKDLEGVINYIPLFINEFSKYTPEFVKNTKLKRIAFVKNLSNLGAKVAAVPDYYKEILYFDIYEGKEKPIYQKHVIHHEYYHMIEEELNGSAYYKDPNWNALNTKDFGYGTGGVSSICRVPGTGTLKHPLEGFLNYYSACGLEEDKAEIFGTLLTDDEKPLLDKFSENDPILQSKIKYMKDFVSLYGLKL